MVKPFTLNLTTEQQRMLDFIFIGSAFLLFALTAAYARFCGKL